MATELPFPLVVKNADVALPETPVVYVLASNGLFMVRRTDLFTACVPVSGGVPGLLAQQPFLHHALPRIPRRLLERAVGFFRTVHTRWQGEAILIMFYAPASEGRPERFAFVAPPQSIEGRFEKGRFRADLRLDYETCERPGPEFRKLGTFHSHGDAGPAHSAIDLHDELYETGLHLTAGYVDSSRPEFAAALVVNRTRFALPVADVLPTFKNVRRPPDAWLAKVAVCCRSWGSWPGTATSSLYSGHSDGGRARAR
jgi:hypothetical protein